MNFERKRWPISDHYDGRRFHNPRPRRHGFPSFLRWMLTRQRGPWQYTDEPPGPPPPPRVDDLRVTFVNHTTVLVQMNDLNILTDPIWAERASPVQWAGPRRHHPPGIRLGDLPRIDAILLSHNHYDHMNLPTLRALARLHQPHVYTGLGNGERLRSIGFRGVQEMDWWDAVELPGSLGLTAVPAQHFSGRTPFDVNRTLWAGFVIEGAAGTVYFAGDSAFGPHVRQIADRFAPVRLALLPIGAFRPQWFMAEVHATPVQAIDEHLMLRARVSVATHFGTFALGDDGEFEPVQALAEALKNTPLDGSEFWVLGFGEGRNVPRL